MHMKLLKAVDPVSLKLSKYDDYIYRLFFKYFRHMNIEVLSDNDLKTDAAKARWRPFCEQSKGILHDYNFGTLVRMDCKEGYSGENCVLVTRIQFLAIEIARNRKGLNRSHFIENPSENLEEFSDKMNNLHTNGDVN